MVQYLHCSWGKGILHWVVVAALKMTLYWMTKHVPSCLAKAWTSTGFALLQAVRETVEEFLGSFESQLVPQTDRFPVGHCAFARCLRLCRQFEGNAEFHTQVDLALLARLSCSLAQWSCWETLAVTTAQSKTGLPCGFHLVLMYWQTLQDEYFQTFFP